MQKMMYLWFLLAGAFAGTCAGLFGVGGGLIIVPVLMAIFKAYGYPSDVITHLAVGTCLLYTSPSPRDGLLSRMPSSA